MSTCIIESKLRIQSFAFYKPNLVFVQILGREPFSSIESKDRAVCLNVDQDGRLESVEILLGSKPWLRQGYRNPGGNLPNISGDIVFPDDMSSFSVITELFWNEETLSLFVPLQDPYKEATSLVSVGSSLCFGLDDDHRPVAIWIFNIFLDLDGMIARALEHFEESKCSLKDDPLLGVASRLRVR